MSLLSILVAILAIGFVAVGLFGFIGWRTRMREVVVWLHDDRKAA